ncbi:GLPGLI family protein [Chryseobacterium ginsenosidimutans]|uniref:GLPGLI family protein n=1 Tax=Chryseobacterium ginsenosidimutans TaxID=687846 RepID=UPI002780F430|nr:GLPGLI family protein [Chryseobacterium ginsenosidimutans]MDQ0592206.1 GLPGLI family protein [Chryseobacterium ginsenosidimutans]
MKKNFITFLCLFSILSFAQKISFEPSIKVEYNASLQLGEKYHHNQKFILFGNSQDYYFAAGQNYLNDTGQYEAKDGIDTQVISDYFKERLIRSGGTTNVFITKKDNKIKYQENIDLKWVLYSDTKIINGVKCQMAATNKYGRRWIAYFSKDYSQSLGPYKFTGLPGLIFELYDTRDDYHFTATEVEKFNDDFKFNLSDFKNSPKEKYLKAKDNLEFTVTGFPVMDSEQNKYMDSVYGKLKKMYNNPLELKPFE